MNGQTKLFEKEGVEGRWRNEIKETRNPEKTENPASLYHGQHFAGIYIAVVTALVLDN